VESWFHGPQGTLRNGWKALLFALGALVCGSAAETLRAGLPGAVEPWLPTRWFTAGAVLMLTWGFLNLEKRPLVSVGLALGGRWARQFLAGALGGTALMALIALGAYLGGGFHLARNPQTGPLPLLFGAWVYLAVAFKEELLFRGYLFQRLEQGLGPWPAMALLAVLFALAHWSNPGMTGPARVWASLNIALAAILLGLGYLRTRSLALPIGLHLGWNWTQGALLGFPVSGIHTAGWWAPVQHGGPLWLTGGSFGLEASLPCTFVAAAACLALACGLPVPQARSASGDLD
jgi:hypothetical protein